MFGYRISVVSNTLDWNHVGRLRRWRSKHNDDARNARNHGGYLLAHRVGNLHLWFDYANPRYKLDAGRSVIDVSSRLGSS